MPPDVEIEAVAGSLVVEEGNAKEERGKRKDKEAKSRAYMWIVARTSAAVRVQLVSGGWRGLNLEWRWWRTTSVRISLYSYGGSFGGPPGWKLKLQRRIISARE